jgi:hypothetical protein
MVLKKTVYLDDDPNGLRLDPVDCDGFAIVERDGGRNGKIYVYYSERDDLVKILNNIDVTEDN